MKKLYLTAVATILMTNLASANPFYPASETTFNFDVSNQIIDDARTQNQFPRHLIELSLPESATAFDKIMFCQNIASDNADTYSSGRILDRNGVSYGVGFNSVGQKCFLSVNANMGDSEHRIAVKYKGTTNYYNLVYRDIEPIEITSVFDNKTIPIKNSYENGERVLFTVGKAYGDLHAEGVPADLEILHQTKTGFWLTGKLSTAGSYSIRITDLNSDNKEAYINYTVAEKPAPEPEPEEPAKCKVSELKIPEGQRIVFRYSMKRVDSDC